MHALQCPFEIKKLMWEKHAVQLLKLRKPVIVAKLQTHIVIGNTKRKSSRSLLYTSHSL